MTLSRFLDNLDAIPPWQYVLGALVLAAVLVPFSFVRRRP